ncbi:MAG: FAD:protein FMN transferase [Clostridia bacterium]|nr:FAD:protein FMN transferase [Clostridia bacterium]
MDTVMELTVYGPEDTLRECENIIKSLEKKLSVTDPGSEIYALNAQGTAQVSDETVLLIRDALFWCEKTSGALDISIYPVLKAWGFTADAYRVPSEEELAELLLLADHTGVTIEGNTVILREGMQIDLGSVAKGYTGDKIMEALTSAGIRSALINLGGNVQVLGKKPDGSPWKVAIADPVQSGYIGYIETDGGAVITSGGYQRFFEEDGVTYHHIIDPSTGYPARSGLLSVTVIGNCGEMCDALSTALFVLGTEKAADFWRREGGFEAVLVADDGHILITEGLKDSFHALSGGKVTVIGRD